MLHGLVTLKVADVIIIVCVCMQEFSCLKMKFSLKLKGLINLLNNYLWGQLSFNFLMFLSHALHFFSTHLVSSGVRWSKVCGSAGDNALYVSHHLWPHKLLQECSSHGLGRGKSPAQPCKPLFCSYLQIFH